MCWFKRHRATGILISSNAARLTLLWCFCVGIIYGLASYPGSWILLILKLFKIEWVISVIYIGNAISLCLYPLAGYLADNAVGRYKMIVRSLQILIIAVVLTILPLIAFTVLAFTSNATNVVGYIGLFATPIFLYFAMNHSFIGFNANVIQFGMEQLHDSPADHQSLFIYWYVSCTDFNSAALEYYEQNFKYYWYGHVYNSFAIFCNNCSIFVCGISQKEFVSC